jgi:hypothetical protein
MPITNSDILPKVLNINETCNSIAINITEFTGNFTPVNGNYLEFKHTYDENHRYYTLQAGDIVDGEIVTIIEQTDLLAIQIANGVLEGLVTVKVKTGNTPTSTAYATHHTIAPCKINCCIAKLAQSGLECDCNCGKCADDLMRAQKAFLMLKGAYYTAENKKDAVNAEKLYLKAAQLCEEVCACGC